MKILYHGTFVAYGIVLTSAPLDSKNFTIFVWPPLSAQFSGVSPPYKHNQYIITDQYYTIHVIGFWKMDLDHIVTRT